MVADAEIVRDRESRILQDRLTDFDWYLVAATHGKVLR